MSWAAKIHLSNGRVISGKILSENEVFLRVDEDGFIQTVFAAQIERIEYDPDLTEPLAEEEADKDGLTAGKRDLIRQLITASGMRRNVENSIEQAVMKMPLERRAEMAELFRAEEVIEAIMPLYGKYYTEEELKDLLEFYKSPVGQKVTEVTPRITRDAMDATIRHFQEKLQVR
jgi:hypothetical protein